MSLERIDSALWEKAEMGDVIAQFELSMQLPLEHEQHLILLRSAALGGHEQAILCMATYEQRQQNFEGVLHWLGLAKDLDCAKAYFRLAELYKCGQGVPSNLEQSVEYYKKAAELGDIEASFELFKSYKDGLGVKKCKETAEKYLNMAKHHQHLEAASIEF